jgi:hypothetical protein
LLLLNHDSPGLVGDPKHDCWELHQDWLKWAAILYMPYVCLFCSYCFVAVSGIMRIHGLKLHHQRANQAVYSYMHRFLYILPLACHPIHLFVRLIAFLYGPQSIKHGSQSRPPASRMISKQLRIGIVTTHQKPAAPNTSSSIIAIFQAMYDLLSHSPFVLPSSPFSSSRASRTMTAVSSRICMIMSSPN